MHKQVEISHYKFDNYLSKQRWSSIWHQLNEIVKLSPRNILEVGPGPGIFKATAGALGIQVETLDIDPELAPDYVASVYEMPFANGSFDVVCAFQMLEHLPFEKSQDAFKEMCRVAENAVVISLPDAATRWPFSLTIPKIGLVQFSIPRPRLKAPEHTFDGEHYWEINKSGYSLSEVLSRLNENKSIDLVKSFRVPENPYHHFFIFQKKK